MEERHPGVTRGPVGPAAQSNEGDLHHYHPMSGTERLSRADSSERDVDGTLGPRQPGGGCPIAPPAPRRAAVTARPWVDNCGCEASPCGRIHRDLVEARRRVAKK
jgi:hypothetical protein